MTFSEQFVAFKTIVIKEYLRFMRIWVQTLIPPVITVALYFVIFGNLIGSQIGNIGEFTYMQFIVPGLVLMALISNSYANVVSSFYGSKFQRNIEEMLISPLPNYLILIGFISGGIARGVIVGLSVLVVSLFFSDLHIHSYLITIIVFLLTSTLFSLAGIINAIYANSFDDITIIPTFVLTPLTYLGGIFYSIQMLPEFWQQVSLINPILYMINAFRYGLLGVSDISLSHAFIIIIGFIIALFMFSLHLLNSGKGLKH
ncbi:MAG: ABC transporter permease [Gammaproteobacteria bacterium]|nr:ABC transporter permease [Gammaproteobacteria bacterium]